MEAVAEVCKLLLCVLAPPVVYVSMRLRLRLQRELASAEAQLAEARLELAEVRRMIHAMENPSGAPYRRQALPVRPRERDPGWEFRRLSQLWSRAGVSVQEAADALYEVLMHTPFDRRIPYMREEIQREERDAERGVPPRPLPTSMPSAGIVRE